jgi:hypothetical protein
MVAIGDGRRSPKGLNHLLKVFITLYPLTVVGWLVALVRHFLTTRDTPQKMTVLQKFYLVFVPE